MVNSTPSDFTPYTRGGTWPPVPPTGRMPLEQRAKIFAPFDAVKGLQEALRKKEREIEEQNPDMDPRGMKAIQLGTDLRDP